MEMNKMIKMKRKVKWKKHEKMKRENGNEQK